MDLDQSVMQMVQANRLMQMVQEVSPKRMVPCRHGMEREAVVMLGQTDHPPVGMRMVLVALRAQTAHQVIGMLMVLALIRTLKEIRKVGMLKEMSHTVMQMANQWRLVSLCRVTILMMMVQWIR